jgi:hypothetical protein
VRTPPRGVSFLSSGSGERRTLLTAACETWFLLSKAAGMIKKFEVQTSLSWLLKDKEILGYNLNMVL